MDVTLALLAVVVVSVLFALLRKGDGRTTQPPPTPPTPLPQSPRTDAPTASPAKPQTPTRSPAVEKVLKSEPVQGPPRLSRASPAVGDAVKQASPTAAEPERQAFTPPLIAPSVSRGSGAASAELSSFLRDPTRSVSRNSNVSQRSTPSPKYEIGVVRFVNQSFGFIIRNTIDLPKSVQQQSTNQPNASHAIFFNVAHVVDNLELQRGDRVQYRVHYPRRTSTSARGGRRSSTGSDMSGGTDGAESVASGDGVVKDKAKAMDVTLVQRGKATVKSHTRKSDVSTGALNWRRASADPGRHRRRSLPMSAMSPPRNNLLRQMRMEQADHVTHHTDATPKLIMRSPKRRSGRTSAKSGPTAGDDDDDEQEEFVEFALHPLGAGSTSKDMDDALTATDTNPSHPVTPPRRRHTTAGYSNLRVSTAAGKAVSGEDAKDAAATTTTATAAEEDGPLAVVEVDGIAASPRDVVLSPTGSRRSKKWRRPSYPESMMMFLQKTDGRRDVLDSGPPPSSKDTSSSKWRAGAGGWRSSFGAGAGAGAGVAVTHRRRSTVRSRKRVSPSRIEGSWRDTLKSP